MFYLLISSQFLELKFGELSIKGVGKYFSVLSPITKISHLLWKNSGLKLHYLRLQFQKFSRGLSPSPPHIPPSQLKFGGKLGLPPRGVMIFTLYKPFIMLKNCCFHLIHRTKWTAGLYIFHYSKKREKKGKIREDRKK